ncbi:MAG: TetR/AcrR family transcriptional regulator [Rhodopila sp.]
MTDRRLLRTITTRKRIVDALIELHKEGHVRPAVQLIADRAGISRRAVFEHFPDTNRLTEAVLDELARAASLAPSLPPAGAPAPLTERIEQFLDGRARRLEAMTPHRRASNQLLPRNKLLQERRTPIRRLFQDETAQWFSAELERLPPDRREHWQEALGALTDWDLWESLRTYPARPVEEARALLGSLLRAAIAEIHREVDAAETQARSLHGRVDKNNSHSSVQNDMPPGKAQRVVCTTPIGRQS